MRARITIQGIDILDKSMPCCSFQVMACLYPKKLTVFPDKTHTFTSGRDSRIVFGQWIDSVNSDGEMTQLYEVPCGKCSECRKAKRRLWSQRLQLEASCYPENEVWFITLTYDDEHITECPQGKYGLYSLCYEHFQQFVLSIKNFVRRNKGDLFPDDARFRYFLGMEYGSRFARPHGHLITFGIDLSELGELLPVSETEEGTLFSSSFVSRFWHRGYNTVCAATPANMCYVTGYVDKKLESNFDYEARGLKPEKCFMSTKPAMGTEFFERNKDLIKECGGYVNPYDGSFHKLPRSSLRNVFSDDPYFVAIVNHRKKISAIRQLNNEDAARGERSELARARIAKAEAEAVKINRAKL